MTETVEISTHTGAYHEIPRQLQFGYKVWFFNNGFGEKFDNGVILHSVKDTGTDRLREESPILYEVSAPDIKGCNTNRVCLPWASTETPPPHPPPNIPNVPRNKVDTYRDLDYSVINMTGDWHRAL